MKNMTDQKNEFESQVLANKPAERRAEIIHHSDADIIINNNSPHALWGLKLADALERGELQSWRPVNDEKTNVRVGEIGGHSFVVKERLWVEKSKEQIDELHIIPEEKRKHEQLAFNSVMSEVRLAPKIKEALESDTLKDALTDGYNLSSIVYVEPIIAVIDRTENNQFANKYVFYPFVPDAVPLNTAEGLRRAGLSRERAYDLTLDLTDYFEFNRISTGDELDPAHILVDQDHKLHLIDTEGYSAIRE
jgi:hypothetical protein